MALKPRTFICKQCNKTFLRRAYHRLCCGYKCSNLYQASLRRETIDPETGLSQIDLFAKRASESIRAAGHYDDPSKLEQRREWVKAMHTDKAKATCQQAMQLRTIPDPVTGLTPAQVATQLGLETKRENGNATPLEDIPAFELYKRDVRRLSNRQELTLLENHEKRGRVDLCDDAYHLDHKYTIFDGFHNDVPVEILGSLCNLQFLPYAENISKHKHSEITKEELYAMYEGEAPPA